MPHDRDRADAPERWIENARADLALARIPLPPGVFYEHLCFHAQQAVEKSVKAVLLAFEVDFPPTHNLRVLIDLLPPEARVIPILKDAVDLTLYAVVTRYPSDFEPVSEEEYREALCIAEAVVAWASPLAVSHK